MDVPEAMGTSINSDPNILVFNIWANASINATDVTLSGSTNQSNDTPFLMVGGYPNGAAGTLVFSGESTITGAKGSVIGGSANSVINVSSGTLTVRDSDIKLLDGVRFVVASEAKLVVENSSLEGDGARPSIVVESGGTCEIENSTLTQVWINNEGTTTVAGSCERQSELVNCVIKARANSVLSISDARA